MFLVNEKWPFLNLFVFDLEHGAYQSASAHFPHELPVLVVDYNRKGTTVSTTGSFRRREVNVRVAEHRNPNGWDREPLFSPTTHRLHQSPIWNRAIVPSWIPYEPRTVAETGR